MKHTIKVVRLETFEYPADMTDWPKSTPLVALVEVVSERQRIIRGFVDPEVLGWIGIGASERDRVVELRAVR